MFLLQLHAGQSLRTDLPGWEKVVSFDQFKSVALTLEKFLFGVIHIELNTTFLVFAVLGVAVALPLLANFLLAFRQQLRSTDNKKLRELSLVLVWLCLPIFLAWVVSFFVPILQPKRVLYCLPAFYLFVAYIVMQPLENLKSLGKRKNYFFQLQLFSASLLAILFLVTLNLMTTLQYYTVPRYQREDWRGVHQQILTQYPTSTVVVFAFPEAFAPWRWYDDGKYPEITTGALTTERSNLNSLKKVTEYQTVLVFDYLRDLTDPQQKIEEKMQEYGYKEVNQITPSTGVGIIHVYQKKEHTIG